MNKTEGKRIQNYVFSYTNLLGKGNFSMVYKAQHQLTKQWVAIKIIELASLKSPKLQELLYSEIDVLKKINHPNVLKCHEVYISSRHCYIITELCNGGDLESFLRRNHTFSENQAQPLIRDIFTGLLYLSSIHVIHRDLKVANIFLHNGQAKIADFGFAKFATHKFKDINIGSPIYMSPEGLIDNLYGPKTDVWAFGIMLFEFFHGQTPFAACKSEGQLKNSISIQLDPTCLKSTLPDSLKELILACLEINEEKRPTFQSLCSYPYLRQIINQPSKSLFSPRLSIIPTSPSSFKSLSQPLQNPHSSAPNKLKPISIYPHIQNDPNLLTQLQKTLKNSLQTLENHSLPCSINQTSFLTLKKLEPSSSSNQIIPIDTHMDRTLTIGKNTPAKPTSSDSALCSRTKKITSQINPNHQQLLPGSLTFKECVNTLHFCRLLYKFLNAIIRKRKPEPGTQLAIDFLLLLLGELMLKTNAQRIIFEGESKEQRRGKLKEVINEYIKKYKCELGSKKLSNTPIEPSLYQLEFFLYNIWKGLDDQYRQSVTLTNDDKELMVMAAVLLEGTKILRIAAGIGLYTNWVQFTKLENLINDLKQRPRQLQYQTYKPQFLL